MDRFEALLNPGTGERRFTFKVNATTYAVVKQFDPVQQEDHTVKFFIGMYEKVRSHWRSLTPFVPTEEEWQGAESSMLAVIELFYHDVTPRNNPEESQQWL